MVEWNWEYITKEVTQSSDSQTYIKVLPKSGVISTLNIKFEATNGSSGNKDSYIQDVVSKIEVIANGTEVLFSATPREIIRLNWLKRGKYPEGKMTEEPDATQYQHFYIDFGRFEGDEGYGLDLSKYNTVDVRITYNLAAVNAVGASGFVSGSAKITIMALRSKPGTGPAVRGLITTKEIKTFTTAASGEEVVELPIGKRYVGLMVYCREDAVADGTDITRVKVDMDKGTRIYCDLDWDHLKAWNTDMFKVDPTVHMVAYKSDADTIDTEVGEVKGYNIKVLTDVDLTNDTFTVINVDTISGDRLTVNMSTVDVTSGAEDITANTTDDELYVTVHGNGVGNAVYVPFALKEDLSDALDSSRYSEIDVVLTQGGAGGTCGVVLQEILT